ncbi:MAG: hypothetical protein GY822_24960 [Deltaproteobacteria bacterium]|nr:hypothetical protein [Deltaproteobacteria bacterium]
MVLEPGDVFVIARDRDIDAFESEWGPIPVGTWFSNGSEDGDNPSGFPIVNGQDTWYIVSPSGTEIDATIEGGKDHTYTRLHVENGSQESSWRESPADDFSGATPGEVPDLPTSGVGLVISE